MGHRPIPLNKKGRSQAEAVARALRRIPLDLVVTSPLRRAQETARIIAQVCGASLLQAKEAAEIGYGEWVGKTFSEVSGEKNFQIYHTTPKKAQAPGGEKMTAVHRRSVGLIEGLRKKHKTGRIAVVSHADVIKSILTHYLGLDLNHILRLRIDNGSVSLLWFNGDRHRVLAVNCPPNPRHLFLPSDQHAPDGRK